MSQLEVDKVIPQSGTTLTLGDSADTITIPSGATFDASNATVTIPAVNLTTGVTGTLPVANGGTNLTSGFANGITEADAWRITTNTVFSGAGASDVTANWERADTSGFDKIGTGLSESSGIFSFPSTGYYYINYFSSMTATSATTYMAIQLMTTPNNSSYSTASSNYGNVIASGQTNNSASFILKVTDITNIKFKFQSERAGTYTLLGSTSESRSGFSTIRLGDI
jgi:hypothetical protein